MRFRPALPTALLAAAAAAAGCGHATAKPDDASLGRRVFSSSCSGCHSLGTTASPSQQGGSLRNYRMTRAEVLNFTRIMPVRGSLSERDLQAVAGYVWEVQRAARGER